MNKELFHVPPVEQIIVEKPMHIVGVIDLIGVDSAIELLCFYRSCNHTPKGGDKTYKIYIPESYKK
jgi:hypothetical protein